MSTPTVWDHVDALKVTGKERVIGALSALAMCGPRAKGAVPAIIPQLRHDDREVKEAALKALEAIGPAAVAAAPLILDITRSELGNEGVGLRPEAGAALASVTRGQLACLPILIEALKTDCYWAGASAAKVIGELGADAAEAVPALAESLQCRAWIVSTELVKALGSMGAAARDALPALEDRMHRGDPEMRKQAKLAREAILDACVA